MSKQELRDAADEPMALPQCVCPCCHQESAVITIDEGVGHTDYWGSQSVHHDYRQVSKCCEVDVDESDYIAD